MKYQIILGILYSHHTPRYQNPKHPAKCIIAYAAPSLHTLTALPRISKFGIRVIESEMQCKRRTLHVCRHIHAEPDCALRLVFKSAERGRTQSRALESIPFRDGRK